MDSTGEPLVKRKVLVVEDNDLSRRLFEAYLEIYGYDAVVTSYGAESVEIAREENPDLILMDIQLPDISGIEAIRRLKADERTKAIPVIVVTAFAMSYERSIILASGCEAYLTKPFRGAELSELMGRYIGQIQPV